MNEYISYPSPVSTFLPNGGQSRVEIRKRLYNYTVSKLLHKHLVGPFNKKVQGILSSWFALRKLA